MAEEHELFDIGRITRPHGLRGEMKAVLTTEFPERFRAMDSVIVQPSGNVATRYKVISARSQKDFVILRLEGIDSVEAAERLRGSLLRVTREELIPLPPGHFYIFDLVGLQVFTDSGQLLGKVKEVLQPGANDVYVVERTDRGKEDILLPAIKDVVKDIDVDSGRMVVHLLPGLVEEE